MPPNITAAGSAGEIYDPTSGLGGGFFSPGPPPDDATPDAHGSYLQGQLAEAESLLQQCQAAHCQALQNNLSQCQQAVSPCHASMAGYGETMLAQAETMLAKSLDKIMAHLTGMFQATYALTAPYGVFPDPLHVVIDRIQTAGGTVPPEIVVANPAPPKPEPIFPVGSGPAPELPAVPVGPAAPLPDLRVPVVETPAGTAPEASSGPVALPLAVSGAQADANQLVLTFAPLSEWPGEGLGEEDTELDGGDY